jgi:hypothetical protein
MESAYVRPQPADPTFSRPARVKKMEASADINTTMFPKLSKRIDSHRSKAFTDENTDRLSSERERCLECHGSFEDGGQHLFVQEFRRPNTNAHCEITTDPQKHRDDTCRIHKRIQVLCSQCHRHGISGTNFCPFCYDTLLEELGAVCK